MLLFSSLTEQQSWQKRASGPPSQTQDMIDVVDVTIGDFAINTFVSSK